MHLKAGRMEIVVRELSAEDDEETNLMLSSCSASLIYYTPSYRKFVQSVIPNTSSLVFGAFVDQKLTGILPSVILRNDKYGDVLNSLPFFGSHGGPLVRDDFFAKGEVREALLVAFSTRIQRADFSSVTLIENPLTPMSDEDLSILELDVVDSRIGQFTDLPAGKVDAGDRIMVQCHQKTRNAIRKGMRQNLKVQRDESSDAVKWLQILHQESITGLGGKAKPLSVFERIFLYIDNARLYVGLVDGHRVCGLLVLTHRHIVEYFTPVVLQSARESQALSALIFRVMTELAQEGFSLWNWGGTWRSQESVFRFKARWGSHAVEYRYFNKLNNPALKVLDRSEADHLYPFAYLYRF
jgi:hypothetical protein